ncbi:carbohydrate-binding family 9-like protein [Planctomycetota bacterium]
MSMTYTVVRAREANAADAVWEKPFWQSVPALSLEHAHSDSSAHRPLTKAKVAYDEEALSLIFSVQNDFIRAATTTLHGPVWQDSCVEFFWAPYGGQETKAYYNLEINCGGTLLLQHHAGPRQETRFIDARQCRCITIASSVSEPLPQETTEPSTWTLEVILPFSVFAQDLLFVPAGPGVIWRANFYKCADHSTRPHWLSWSPVSSGRPDFHRPDCFGALHFV